MEKQLITQSRLGTWTACKRLHKLKYLDGYRTTRESEALKFGTMVHVGLETWWGNPNVDAACKAIRTAAGKETDPFLVEKAVQVMKAYPDGWNRDEFEVVAVELPATWPLINPETMKPSRVYEMGGVIDLVIRRKSTGEIILVEHKTTAYDFEDDAAPYWDKLTMDRQLSLYVVAAESQGYKIDRIIYDVLARPGMNKLKATPQEKRKYRKDGALYGNLRDKDETIEEFRVRLANAIFDRPRRYHRTREIARLEHEIREGMQDVWFEAKFMREAERMGRHPRNPGACHNYGTCDFWPVCAQGVDPEFSSEYRRLEDFHPELTNRLKAGAADGGGVAAPVSGTAEPVALADSRR